MNSVSRQESGALNTGIVTLTSFTMPRQNLLGRYHRCCRTEATQGSRDERSNGAIRWTRTGTSVGNKKKHEGTQRDIEKDQGVGVF